MERVNHIRPGIFLLACGASGVIGFSAEFKLLVKEVAKGQRSFVSRNLLVTIFFGFKLLGNPVIAPSFLILQSHKGLHNISGLL